MTSYTRQLGFSSKSIAIVWQRSTSPSGKNQAVRVMLATRCGTYAVGTGDTVGRAEGMWDTVGAGLVGGTVGAGVVVGEGVLGQID
mmetsp:Transcript_24457/g.56443  ORF Transcript_24457/g.56443 Transcript_24457/m.56443 type:complete len:86 (-) Transcript_24457:929-1186(-)